MKFRSCDLKPGDRVAWSHQGEVTLEVVIVNVDDAGRRWTHMCVHNPRRPEQIGEFYTTPGADVESWELYWNDAAIVSRTP
jgi:hypothetical protein